MTLFNGVVEVRLPSGRAANVYKVRSQDPHCLRDCMASEIAGELERSVNPEVYEALCEWARTRPFFKEGHEFLCVAFAVLAIACERNIHWQEVLALIKEDKLAAHLVLFH